MIFRIKILRINLACVLLLTSTLSWPQTPAVAFDGVEKWKDSLTADSIHSLKGLYSTDPPARFMPQGQKQPVPDVSGEIEFWQNLLSSGMTDFKAEPIEEQDQRGLHIVSLAVSMKTKTPDGPRTRYVTERQAWQKQGETWRIVMVSHSDVVKMPPALHRNPNLYDKNANAIVEIEEAEVKARQDHQRIILVFGANWCYDCHVLDQAFHQPDVASVLEKGFQVVHVDIGDDGKKNNNLAANYDVPLNKGIPALAVLDANGKLLYSQKNGEWESARSLDPDEITKFLDKWKP